MGRSLVFGALFVVILFAGASSRSDVVSDPTAAPSTATSEPTTEAPAQNVSQPTKGHQPFTPYFAGPAPWDKSPRPLWQYDDLTLAEKDVVDHGRDTTGWGATNDAFAAASAGRAKQAAAASAAAQLGLDNTNLETGVVP